MADLYYVTVTLTEQRDVQMASPQETAHVPSNGVCVCEREND